MDQLRGRSICVSAYHPDGPANFSLESQLRRKSRTQCSVLWSIQVQSRTFAPNCSVTDCDKHILWKLSSSGSFFSRFYLHCFGPERVEVRVDPPSTIVRQIHALQLGSLDPIVDRGAGVL